MEDTKYQGQYIKVTEEEIDGVNWNAVILEME